MMLNSNMIGNKIATARKRANLSQADLAQQVSISAQAVGKWERGESMPDITTLNRLAELLGVDLNYFSDRFSSADTPASSPTVLADQMTESPDTEQKQTPEWDMSRLHLVDADFSGLKNLHEKFSSSNMQRCLFVGADMAGLLLNNNNIDRCDFTYSNISNSQIRGSNLGKNRFVDCSLKVTEISKCNVEDCDFSGADFTKTTLRYSNFMKNTVTGATWSGTSFIGTQLQDIVFEGTFDGCFFENCSFYGVKFQQATLLNTFFKNNDKLKRVQFVDCKVDKITYAFLKSNRANLEGGVVIE